MVRVEKSKKLNALPSFWKLFTTFPKGVKFHHAWILKCSEICTWLWSVVSYLEGIMYWTCFKTKESANISTYVVKGQWDLQDVKRRGLGGVYWCDRPVPRFIWTLIGGTEAYTNSYTNPNTWLILNKRIDCMYCGRVSKQILSIYIHQFTLHSLLCVCSFWIIRKAYICSALRLLCTIFSKFN